MSALAVVNVEGKKIEEIELPEAIFGGRINQDVLHQAVVMYRACLRQGTASTKERGAVSGGGVKPWRQKGTGRARVGSIRNPIWRGGGVVFGPHPREFRYSIPAKIRKAALREALNDKFLSHMICCLDHFAMPSAKTRDFARILKNLKLTGKILTLVHTSDNTAVRRACQNIPFLNLMRATDVTAYDILRHHVVLVSKPALKDLLKRLS